MEDCNRKVKCYEKETSGHLAELSTSCLIRKHQGIGDCCTLKFHEMSHGSGLVSESWIFLVVREPNILWHTLVCCLLR
jgi:hypothetical protein